MCAHVCVTVTQSETRLYIFGLFSHLQVQSGLSCSLALSIAWEGPLSKKSPAIFTLLDWTQLPVWLAGSMDSKRLCYPVFRLRGGRFPCASRPILCPRIAYNGGSTFLSVEFMLDVLYLSLQNTLHPFPPCSVHGEADWYGFYQQEVRGKEESEAGDLDSPRSLLHDPWTS